MDTKTRIAYITHAIGTPAFFFITSIAIILLLIALGEATKATMFAFALVAVSSLAGLLKIILRVARPVDAFFELSSFAFPSGHSAGVAFLMVGILYLVQDTLSLFWYIAIATILMVLVALVAVSRVILKVHTPFQVFVGLSIGFVLSIAIFMNQDIVLSLL